MTIALLNLLLICMTVLSLAALVSVIQNILNERKHNKRIDAQMMRDQEYHEKRMKRIEELH